MFAFCSSSMSPLVRSRQGIESLSLWRRRSLFLSPRRTQGAPSLSMASPIQSELLPALEALYAAPTGVSSPGSSSSDDAEQRRRAAERWLVAFQASDAAWQVRERVRSCCQRDGVFIISLFYASWKWLKRRGERRCGTISYSSPWRYECLFLTFHRTYNSCPITTLRQNEPTSPDNNKSTWISP